MGYDRRELEGKKFLDFVHPEDVPATTEAMAGLYAGKEIIGFINRYRGHDGSYRWLEWRSAPYQGRLVFAAARDITTRKQAEEALQQSEDKFRLAFDTSPDSININRLADGLFVDINQGFTKLTGFTREDVIARTSLEVNLW